MGHLHKLLVPVDGSPASVAALRYAVMLAEDTGADVEVLHVRAPDAFEVGATSPSAAANLEEAEHERAAAVDDAKAQLGDRVSERTEAGDPLRRILEVADADAVDLVVMGTHGRVGRLHSLFGSVAEGVVRNAPCPVLTVREPGSQDESFAERIHRSRSIGAQTSSR